MPNTTTPGGTRPLDGDSWFANLAGTSTFASDDVFFLVGSEQLFLANFALAAYHLDSSEKVQSSVNNPAPAAAGTAFSGVSGLIQPLTAADLPSLTPLASGNSNFPIIGLTSSGLYLNGNAAAFVGRTSDALFIAFRGTNDIKSLDDISNAAANGSATPDTNDWFTALQYAAFFPQLVQAAASYALQQNIKNVFLAGHSVGGAVVQDILRDNPDTAQLHFHGMTFGDIGLPGAPVNDPRIVNFLVAGEAANQVNGEGVPFLNPLATYGLDGPSVIFENNIAQGSDAQSALLNSFLLHDPSLPVALSAYVSHAYPDGLPLPADGSANTRIHIPVLMAYDFAGQYWQVDPPASGQQLTGNAADDIFMIHPIGHSLGLGKAGHDTYYFDGPAAAGFDLTIADFDQGNSAVYMASEGDALDITQLVIPTSSDPESYAAFVRVVNNQGTLVDVQADPDGPDNGISWTKIASLQNIHAGQGVGVILSASQTTPIVIYPLSNNAQMGDYDGDGQADVGWRNVDDPGFVLWSFSARYSTHGVITNAIAPDLTAHFTDGVPNDWHVLGDGDFNNDGKSDMLWQNDNGALLIWQFGDSFNFTPVGYGTAPTGAVLAGIGDVDADGRSDLVWRDTASGAITINTAANASQTFNSVDNSWAVIGVADYNGDGMADIMFRNAGLGVNAAWLMNGTTIANTVFYAGVPNTWHVAAHGDFNGDHTTDVFWLNDDGASAVWFLDGDAAVTQAVFYDGVGQIWHPIGSGDFNGDHKDDIMWRADDGATAVWQMNGAGSPNVEFLGGVPNVWDAQAHHYEVV